MAAAELCRWFLHNIRILSLWQGDSNLSNAIRHMHITYFKLFHPHDRLFLSGLNENMSPCDTQSNKMIASFTLGLGYMVLNNATVTAENFSDIFPNMKNSAKMTFLKCMLYCLIAGYFIFYILSDFVKVDHTASAISYFL